MLETKLLVFFIFIKRFYIFLKTKQKLFIIIFVKTIKIKEQNKIFLKLFKIIYYIFKQNIVYFNKKKISRNMYQHYKFSLEDSNYNDNIRTNPAHFNSMRAKPTYPQALIEVIQ